MLKSGSRITLADFEELVEAGGLEELRRGDLERFVYDVPRDRVALIAWRSGCWWLVQGGDARRLGELHSLGELLFGSSPWKAAQVLRVVGLLGSVEAAIAALPAPGAGFEYRFEAPKEVGVAGPSRRFRPGVAPGRDHDMRDRDRARWREFDRADLARRERDREREHVKGRQLRLF